MHVWVTVTQKAWCRPVREYTICGGTPPVAYPALGVRYRISVSVTPKTYKQKPFSCHIVGMRKKRECFSTSSLTCYLVCFIAISYYRIRN